MISDCEDFKIKSFHSSVTPKKRLSTAELEAKLKAMGMSLASDPAIPAQESKAKQIQWYNDVENLSEYCVELLKKEKIAWIEFLFEESGLQFSPVIFSEDIDVTQFTECKVYCAPFELTEYAQRIAENYEGIFSEMVALCFLTQGILKTGECKYALRIIYKERKVDGKICTSALLMDGFEAQNFFENAIKNESLMEKNASHLNADTATNSKVKQGITWVNAWLSLFEFISFCEGAEPILLACDTSIKNLQNLKQVYERYLM